MRYPQGYKFTWVQMDLGNDASCNLHVQFGFDCRQIELCWIILPEWKKKSKYATFCVNRCVSTCVYPQGGRNHYPQHGMILLSSDQSLEGHGLELQCRQMGDAWENNKLSLLPQLSSFHHLIWLICCSSL